MICSFGWRVAPAMQFRRGVTDDEISLLMRALGLEPARRGLLARRLTAVGGLVGLWRAGPEALDGVGGGAGVRWGAIAELWGALHRPADWAASIDNPQALLACLDPFLPLAPVERFIAVFVDGRGRFGGAAEVARGAVDSCLVHPREVFAPAIRARAAAVAVVHNHPSGDPDPSDADRALTDRLAAAGHVIGIPLVDHLIVGRSTFRSLGPGDPSAGVA